MSYAFPPVRFQRLFCYFITNATFDKNLGTDTKHFFLLPQLQIIQKTDEANIFFQLSIVNAQKKKI